MDTNSLLHSATHISMQGSHLFVEVADGKGRGNFQPRVVDIGEVGLVSGRWHALVIWHRRSSALLFNKDKLEASVVSKKNFRIYVIAFSAYK